jgi:hypothetical protein
LEVVEHVIDVSVLSDVSLFLLNVDGHLSHVLSDLTELLDVGGHSHDLDVHVVDIEHDLVSHDLSLSSNELDLLTGDFEMLFTEEVSDSSGVNREE